MNNIERAISKDGGVVITAIDSTNIVGEMEQIHHTSSVASAALGRLLTAAALMGYNLKNEEDSLTLRLKGNGPIGTLLCVSDGSGNVRGYAQNPFAEVPLRADGKLNVGGAVGKNGTLAVIRDMGLKEPYIGQVPLVSGEIAEDITAYYASSEQTPSVCALGVLVNSNLSIQCAGGFLLQLLPGATDKELQLLEANIAALPSVTDHLNKGGSLWQLIQMAMDGFEPELLEKANAHYQCRCSEKRSEQILLSLGEEELRSMAAERPTAKVECHFCNKSYTFSLDDLLQKLPQTSAPQP